MSLLRLVARPLLAAPFIVRGVDALLHPMNRAERTQPMADRLPPAAGPLGNPEHLVRASGVVMVGAGALLATGTAPRVSAAVLAATSLPAIYTDRPFWTIEDPQQRRDQRALLLRELALVGGLLLAAADTEGRPGLAWRGRRAVTDLERSAHRASRQARTASWAAKRTGRLLRRQARLEARLAQRNVQRATQDVLPG